MPDVSHLTGADPSVYDLFADYDTMVDPYPLYRRLLAERPVDASAGPVVLTRYADVNAALRHPDLSTDDRHDAVHRERAASGELSPALIAMAERRSFLHRDPPDHTRLRTVLGTALTRQQLVALTPVVRRFVDEAIDRADGGTIELIADLAYPLPLAIACHLLGTAPEDHLNAAWWRSQLCSDFEAPAVAGDDCADYSDSVQGKMIAYFDTAIAAKRRTPGDDVISRLIAAEQRGELTPDEVNDICRLALVAAHETTTDLIANGMLALLRNPTQLQMLRDDPSIAETAIEEILRYDSPIQFTRRIAVTDLNINGTPINSGQMVLLWIASANRDPATFPNPDRFDITRTPNPHFGFGAGIHSCLSTELARLQGRIALTTLCQRLIEPTLVTDPPPYLPNAIHAIAKLPIEFRSTRTA